ncbi:MAG TPA: serine hydrolase domain-containing protein [Terriglobales bacterium]|nr:serine hydrolase domain-containing protein [Terriglobales bacterium]
MPVTQGLQHSNGWALPRGIWAIAMVFFFLTTGSWGQKPQTNPLAPKAKPVEHAEQVPQAGTHAMTPDDVSAFLDGIMPQQLGSHDVAGVVISIVKDGKVLFAKGYGFSDVAKRTPVSADGTLFRPGSISKLFTWTAVMQLVEQGKLDLDRDVNDYLDYKIPPAFGKPITLRNVMTHTPGFEEAIQELFVADAKDLKPLGEYVKQHLPARIFPPGTTPAYSNYATAMAGYIVQRVSGQAYDDYIEQHILQPLGMAHSTFRQPLPESLKGMMSQGYDVASEPPKGFEYVEAAPAGSSSVTAMDMTHFMLAHLQDGQFEGKQILKPETVRMMHSPQFELLPGMNEMALGFYEETRNGHRIIGHGGDTQYFHSDLHLMPDAQLGFFISYNSAGKGEGRLREAVWHAFLDRYFPYQVPKTDTTTSPSSDASSIFGHYISSRRSQTTIMKVITVAGETKIYPNDDGTISVSDIKGMNGEPKKFREIAPLMFREVNGQDRVGFKRDSSGNMVEVMDFPVFVFLKSPWNDNSAFQLPLLVCSLVVIVIALILWPVMALVRRHYAKPLNLTPEQRRRRRWVRLACLAYVIFFGAYLYFFSLLEKDIGLLSPRANPWLRLIQIVGWLGVLGTIIAIYNAVKSWLEPRPWFWSRIGETLIALACVGVVWFIFTWNLLHWSLKY